MMMLMLMLLVRQMRIIRPDFVARVGCASSVEVREKHSKGKVPCASHGCRYSAHSFHVLVIYLLTLLVRRLLLGLAQRLRFRRRLLLVQAAMTCRRELRVLGRVRLQVVVMLVVVVLVLLLLLLLMMMVLMVVTVMVVLLMVGVMMIGYGR